MKKTRRGAAKVGRARRGTKQTKRRAPRAGRASSGDATPRKSVEPDALSEMRIGPDAQDAGRGRRRRTSGDEEGARTGEPGEARAAERYPDDEIRSADPRRG